MPGSAGRARRQDHHQVVALFRRRREWTTLVTEGGRVGLRYYSPPCPETENAWRSKSAMPTRSARVAFADFARKGSFPACSTARATRARSSLVSATYGLL